MPAHNGYGQEGPADPSPVGRERAGHDLITDGNRTRLPVVLTGSNRDGVTQLPALDAAQRCQVGRPHRRPVTL
ncbi:hypothetical protein [Streptomyces kaempferi]|uniref:Uncharacterized protein n=1 Tax=Streptomyces kaempferi TaxID=333725 RepID=A0ABW3XN20_9ACTN